MDQFKFDTSYNQYWKDRVKHASDGTKVPGLEVIEELVAELKISSKDKVLDLGCGQTDNWGASGRIKMFSSRLGQFMRKNKKKIPMKCAFFNFIYNNCDATT